MVNDPDALRMEVQEGLRLLRERRNLSKCPDCRGEGKREDGSECLRCDGEGKIDQRGD